MTQSTLCNCRFCECQVIGNNLHVRNGVCFNCSVGNHFGKHKHVWREALLPSVGVEPFQYCDGCQHWLVGDQIVDGSTMKEMQNIQ
jgi:hypothetical protein